MRDVTMEPIVESMQRMQKEHQLFNEGDQRTIDRMMAQVTGKSVFGTDARTPQNAPQRSSVMDDVKFTKAAPQAAPSKDDVHERRVNQAEEISKDVEQRQNDGDQFDYGG